ncbi:hypothetical protein [Holdemanella biformis]|uniref:hypothetical protein n=1 Tax=Holdemanella biformis TaxID=1735 RepID=UPI0026DF25BA|nr:hypothetical protein [Holdemanella biformis]
MKYTQTDFMVTIGNAKRTHFVFPESMLKMMLPIGSASFVKFAFQSARKHPKECLETRIDIDVRIRNAIEEWKKGEVGYGR